MEKLICIVNSFVSAQEGDGLQHKLSVCNDNRYVYYQFAQLLQKADMVMSSNYIFGLAGASHVIGFIPTNEAISTAIAAGQIPWAWMRPER